MTRVSWTSLSMVMLRRSLSSTPATRERSSLSARRPGDWPGAEDLTSLVFLEAWRTRHRAFLVQGSLRPWLLGIAANVVSTSRRSLHRHRAALARFAGSAEVGDDDVAVVATQLGDRGSDCPAGAVCRGPAAPGPARSRRVVPARRADPGAGGRGSGYPGRDRAFTLGGRAGPIAPATPVEGHRPAFMADRT
jgi:hypothetical protein